MSPQQHPFIWCLPLSILLFSEPSYCCPSVSPPSLISFLQLSQSPPLLIPCNHPYLHPPLKSHIFHSKCPPYGYTSSGPESAVFCITPQSNTDLTGPAYGGAKLNLSISGRDTQAGSLKHHGFKWLQKDREIEESHKGQQADLCLCLSSCVLETWHFYVSFCLLYWVWLSPSSCGALAPLLISLPANDGAGLAWPSLL